MTKNQHVILTALCGFCLLLSVVVVVVNGFNKNKIATLNQLQAIVNQGGACQQQLQSIATAAGEKSMTNYKLREMLAKYGISYKPNTETKREGGK